MRLGTCLLFVGRTLQAAHPKPAYFFSDPVAGLYAAVDNVVLPPRHRRLPAGTFGRCVPMTSRTTWGARLCCTSCKAAERGTTALDLARALLSTICTEASSTRCWTMTDCGLPEPPRTRARTVAVAHDDSDPCAAKRTELADCSPHFLPGWWILPGRVIAVCVRLTLISVVL